MDRVVITSVRILPAMRFFAVRAHRIVSFAALALLPAGVAAALLADSEPANVVAHGSFATTAVNLRLPAVSPFPLVAGGWGGRGGTADDITTVRDEGRDQRVLQVTSSPDDPVHVLQDVPLATRSFVLELSVRRIRGRQALILANDWDRMDPGTASDGLTLQLGASGLRVRTPQGVWPVEGSLADGRWVRIRLVADARRELVEVWLDDRLAATLPGLPRPPRTLILGGNAARADSRFRYDDVTLFRLAEIELAQLRRDALRLLPEQDLPWVTERLDGAATALGRGDSTLAAPEIRAATRLLERAAATRPELQDLVDHARSLAALASAS